MDIKKIFGRDEKIVIGMVHCLPLPGTMGYRGSVEDIIVQAVNDAKTLEAAGCTGIIVENMGDSPFGISMDEPQAAVLSIVADHVKRTVSIPIGIDAAMNDYRNNFAIAKAVGATFVRIPVFVDTVEFYGGVIKPVAREAIAYRSALACEDVAILADIQVKHTHMLLSEVSIEDSAKNAQDCGADAVIVTGRYIGTETPMDIIRRAKKVIKLPLIVASGVKPENIKEQLNIANGAIIGSSLKIDGVLSNPISAELCQEIFDALNN
ncbi:MAG: BtpA/SgcQ family protein [Tissierellia bacterium]|nr:BtpA/SgcQ family protein [Tissierellia bacterium]